MFSRQTNAMLRQNIFFAVANTHCHDLEGNLGWLTGSRPQTCFVFRRNHRSKVADCYGLEEVL